MDREKISLESCGEEIRGRRILTWTRAIP